MLPGAFKMLLSNWAIGAVFLLGILFVICFWIVSKECYQGKYSPQENSAEQNAPQEENEEMLENNIPSALLDTNSSDIICNQFNLPSYEDALKM